MVNSRFWSDRGAEFERILRDYPARTHEDVLRAAHNSAVGWGGGGRSSRWHLAGGTKPARDEFKVIAALAAVSGIGCARSADAWMAWLDCLRDEDVDVEWTTTMAGGSDGDCRPDHEPIRARLAAIGDVCTSSARVCRKLHAEALTIERLPPGTPAAAVDESQPEPDATEGPASSAPDPLDSKQGRMAAVTACRAACAVAEGRLIPPPANWVWKAAEYADRRPYHDWINTGTNSARFRTVLRLPAEEVIKRARAWRPKSR